MIELRARLAKITFGQAPAFLVGISVVRTEMESGEQDRRYFLAVAVILFGVLLDLAPPRKKFLESRRYRKPAVAQARHAPRSAFSLSPAAIQMGMGLWIGLGSMPSSSKR